MGGNEQGVAPFSWENIIDERDTASLLSWENGVNRGQFLGTLLGVAVGGSLLAQAARAAAGAPTATTFRVAEADSISDLDPDGANAATSYAAWETWASVYDTLTDFVLPSTLSKSTVAKGLPVGPRLASSWEWSRDKRTIRFNLRRGVKSGFGNELTSADVVWRYQRALATKNIAAFLLAAVGNVVTPASITAIDTYTVQLKLAAATPDLLRALSTFWLGIIDSTEAKKHATASDKWAKGWLAKNTASFGAYSVTSNNTQAVTMQARSGYWSKAPGFKTIVIQNVPEPNNRVQLLLSGNVDAANALTPLQLELVERNSNLHVAHPQSTLGTYLVMNVKQAPFNDPRIRRSIARAVPYSAIIQSAYRGNATRWKTICPTFMLGATDRYWSYETNLAAARAGLAGIGNQRLTLNYQLGRGAAAEAAILVASNLQKAGVNAQAQGLDATQFFQRQIGGLAFYIVEDGPTIASPYYYYYTFFSKKGIRNLASYTSPSVEKLVGQLRTAMLSENLRQQASVTQQIQRVLVRDLPVIPLASRVGALAMSTKFRLPRIHNGGGLYNFSRDIAQA